MKIKSFEELDQSLLVLGKAKAELQRQEATMNEEIQKIKDKFAEDTAELMGITASLEDAIESFCIAHKSEFDATRTKILNHGKVGFRTNPPKVLQLNKKWKVESSIAFLKKLFGKKYLREKLEIDKEAILADYAIDKIKDEDLAGAGLRIEQEETFICEPDWTKIENVKLS